MSSFNFIKRIYRNSAWFCKCGASSYEPKHSKDCPFLIRELERAKRQRQIAKMRNRKVYKSKTWKQAILHAGKDHATLPENKLTNEKMEKKEAWRDDLKPAWGMDFAASQGLSPVERAEELCEPNEIVVHATDGRLLRIDRELYEQWPVNEAGDIIPPPCISFYERKDPVTRMRTGEYIVQPNCMNYEECPYDHEPLPLVVKDSDLPDKPEILYGVSMPSRRVLDEYISNNYLLHIGEAEFRMNFYENSSDEELEIDKLVTALTGISVDEIPEDEVMCGDLEQWEVSAATARLKLGVISRAYKEMIRQYDTITNPEVAAQLHYAIDHPDEYGGIFDTVQECVADILWQERHDAQNSGKLKAISRGREYEPENPTGYTRLQRRWICERYVSAGFLNPRARARFSISRRLLLALADSIRNNNISRTDLLTIRDHITRCAIIEEAESERVETSKIEVTDPRHSLHKFYTVFLNAAKKRWKQLK